MSTHDWRASVKARAAVVGVTALGLALYGLLGAGAKSAVVPFQGKNVSTVQTDKYAVAVTFDFNGPSGADDIDALAMGPSHSLYFYWQSKGVWSGPLQVGVPGTAYSGPGLDSEVVGSSSHLAAAVEGPNHSLYFFWQIGQTWYGPLQIGAPGSTWSKPAVTVDTSGHVNVSALGPNGSLYQYWSIGGAWNGPFQVAGPSSAFSAPAMHATSSGCPPVATPPNVCLGVAVKGPANQSVVYWDVNGQWTAPSTSGQNQQYSSPSIASFGTSWFAAYQGPGNSFISQASAGQGGSNAYCVIAGAGTTYGAPTEVGPDQATNAPVSFNLAAAGPSGSLYAYWFQAPAQPTTCPSFYGPLQLTGAGTLHSVPSENYNADSAGNARINVLAEGPSNTLWVFWNEMGTWYGPLQVGGPGTTFDSAN